MGSEVHPLAQKLIDSYIVTSGESCVASQVIRKWLESHFEQFGTGYVIRIEEVLRLLGLAPIVTLEQKIEEALADHAGHLHGAAKIAAEIAEKHFKEQS